MMLASSPLAEPEKLFAAIPDVLREPLLASYNSIVDNFRKGHWEPSELNGGKLCEAAYSIIRGYVDGVFPSSASKPSNMADACRQLEQASSTIPRSARIQIPRMIVALYEIRNNRGVGHVGGDVDPNRMDATAVLYMAKWILAEMVRLFHNVDTQTASSTVDALAERLAPMIWDVAGRKRVLKPSLSMKDRTLLLLYSRTEPILEQVLFQWVEHSNSTNYRRDVLRPLHRAKLVEYDPDTRLVYLSPEGSCYVEERLIEG